MSSANQNTISVRDATLADTAFVKDMIWLALLASPAFVQQLGMEATKKEQETYWQTWNPNDSPAFIAEDSKTQIRLGAILLRTYLADDLLKWRIGMAVEASARGQGVGQLLLNRAIEFSKASEIKLLTLFVDSSNTPAIKLYKSSGFTEIGKAGSLIQMDYALFK